MRRTGTWLLLAALACASPAGAQSLADARAFVTGLYRAYQSSPETDGLGRPARNVFSPRLLALIRRDERNAHGEVGALDGDPICDCQDPNGIRLTRLDVASVGARRAIARAHVRFADKTSQTITLDLVAVAGRWRVDDVRTADTPSLARLLGGRG